MGLEKLLLGDGGPNTTESRPILPLILFPRASEGGPFSVFSGDFNLLVATSHVSWTSPLKAVRWELYWGTETLEAKDVPLGILLSGGKRCTVVSC